MTEELQSAETSAPASDSRRPAYGFAPAMVSVFDKGGAQVDAIRALRTHVMAQHVNHGRRALAVCGPSAGVGASFVAANLAAALAQIGVKTLLIDGDMRGPSLDVLIRPPHEPGGLAGCLAQRDAPFNDSIDAEVLPNLSILYAGQSRRDAQELLAGERFRALMNYCLREFDMTIIDSPPANTSSDARRICAVAGYALIVTARDKTAIKDIKVLAEQLQADRAVVIGTVLNRA
jgi:capsular exopolysaccharide synthesis family protein